MSFRCSAFAPWAKANPSKVKAALAQNPSYIFFEERKSDTELGPIGAAGVPLTPEASVAVDQKYWKLGTPFIVSISQELACTGVYPTGDCSGHWRCHPRSSSL